MARGNLSVFDGIVMVVVDPHLRLTRENSSCVKSAKGKEIPSFEKNKANRKIGLTTLQ